MTNYYVKQHLPNQINKHDVTPYLTYGEASDRIKHLEEIYSDGHISSTLVLMDFINTTALYVSTTHKGDVNIMIRQPSTFKPDD